MLSVVQFQFGSRDEAQPGTVIFLQSSSCIPGECGDNSTTFNIIIGGLTLERLNTPDTSLAYAGRFPNFQAANGNAPVQIMTQYQTFQLGVFNDFELSVAPPIASVMPNRGQRGTNVVVMGDDLIGLGLNVAITRVRFGEVDAEIVDASNRRTIRVRARSGIPGTVDISINTTETLRDVIYDGPYLSLLGGWTQLEDGNITDIIPPAAQPGRSIFLCGENLLGGGTTLVTIQHGLTAFTILTGPSQALPPFPGSECAQAQVTQTARDVSIITVVSDTGSMVLSTINFTVSAIESINPSRGQPRTIVTIQGQGLLSGYDGATPFVYLSGIPAMTLQSSNSEIVVRTGSPPTFVPQVINATTGATEAPPDIFGVMGGVEIRVQNPLDPSTVFNVSQDTGWQYEMAGVIEFVFPAYGQFGTVISINGSNLLAYGTSLTHATIGGVNATILDNATDTLVRLVVPDSSMVGMVDVILFSDTGASVRGSNVFEYRERGRITNAQPNRGQRGTIGKEGIIHPLEITRSCMLSTRSEFCE